MGAGIVDCIGATSPSVPAGEVRDSGVWKRLVDMGSDRTIYLLADDRQTYCEVALATLAKLAG